MFFSGLTLLPLFGLFISVSLFKQILNFPPAVVLNYPYDVAITLNSFHQHYNFGISNDWDRDDGFFRIDHKICNDRFQKKAQSESFKLNIKVKRKFLISKLFVKITLFLWKGLCTLSCSLRSDFMSSGSALWLFSPLLLHTCEFLICRKTGVLCEFMGRLMGLGRRVDRSNLIRIVTIIAERPFCSQSYSNTKSTPMEHSIITFLLII